MNNPLMNKFFIFILLLIGVVFLYRISFVILGLLMPFILGLIIAALANPLKKKLEEMGIKGALSSIFSLLVLFIVIGLFVYLLAVIARSGIATAGDYTSQMVSSFSTSLKNTYSTLKAQFPSLLPEDYNSFIEGLKGGGLLTLNGLDFSTRIFAVAKSLPSMLIFIIFTLMSSFYFSLEFETILDFLKERIMVIGWIDRTLRNFRKSAKLGLASWFKAQLYIMSATSLISISFFLVIGVSYAIPLGLALAIFDALPIFGAGAFLWPMTIFYLVTGVYTKALLSIVVYVLIVFTRQIIEPRFIGKQIGIHPLVTLLTIYVSFKLLGVPGILLGVIGLAIATSILNTRVLHKQEE